MKNEMKNRIAFGFSSEITSARRNGRPTAPAPPRAAASTGPAASAGAIAPTRHHDADVGQVRGAGVLDHEEERRVRLSSDATPSAAAIISTQSPRKTPAAAR